MFGLYDWIAISLFAAFCLADMAGGARRFPAIAGWRLKGGLAFVVYFFVAGYSPFLWDGWLGRHTLIDVGELPLWARIGVGFLALELGIYAWHRLVHNVPLLWRWTHQMHHSPERVDIFGAFYFHPFDMLAFTFMGSLALVGVVGIGAEAAAIVNTAAAFCAMFQHANIRTPHWLGYVVMRPESHSIHHQRGLHRYNYSDLPLIDLMFGTLRNPREWNGEAGFFDGSSSSIGPMLIGREIA